MPAVTNYNNTLPDPNFPADTLGSPGPGYSSLAVEANQPTVYSTTQGAGRVGGSLNQRGYWTVTISYNDLPKDLFDIIYAFLLEKKQSMSGFYVNLPNFSRTSITPKTLINISGHSNQILEIQDTDPSRVYPFSGDYFNLISSTGEYHGLYKVSRVETPSNKLDQISLAADRERWTIWPNLPKDYLTKAPTANNPQFSNVRLFGRIDSPITYKIGDSNLYQLNSLVIREVKNGV